jgi:hypothetical protein
MILATLSVDALVAEVVCALTVAAVAWLARTAATEVLALRRDLVELRGQVVALEQRNLTRDADCQRHQKWLGDIQAGVADLGKGQARQEATLAAIAASVGAKRP